MDSSSPSRSGFSPTHVKVSIFLFAVIVSISVVAFTFLRLADRDRPRQAPAIVTPFPVAVTPPADTTPKTDFGTNIPEDFPTNIPLPAGVSMAQSYRLDYPGQKQLTAVFLSPDTVKQNYTLYADFLKKDAWTTTNTYEGTTVSSLYAVKDTYEINVTISPEQTGSQVSISVLKK